MKKYLLKSLLTTPLTLFLLITISFFIIRLAPGDPFADERELSPQARAAYEKKYHLDKPLMQQYGHMLLMTLQGDLGLSMRHEQKSVNEIILDTLPPSLYLGSLALLMAMALGILAGTISAIRQNTPSDFTLMAIAVLGISLPTFLIGPLLQILFAVNWQIFPISGYEGGSFSHMILPALTLSLPFAARIARLMRAGMIDALQQEYIRTAKAKGLSQRVIILKHAMRGGILPVVSFLGPAIASITTGSLVVEKIFSLPGLGREFVESALNRDFSLVLGTVIVYGTFIIFCNMLSDLIHCYIDPRVQLQK